MKPLLTLGCLICGANAFAATGLVTTLFPGGHEVPRAIHNDLNSKLLAVGWFGNTPHGGLARYLSNGALDVTFGGNGKVGTLVGTSLTHLREFDTAQGKIVAVGDFNFGTCLSPIILRYNDNDGSLDTSFGSSGMVFPAIGNCNQEDAGFLNDVKIDGNNRIVVSGVSSAGHQVIARYSWSGNPDNSFGSQGVFDLTQAVKNVGEDATGLYIRSLRLANGEIIAAGSTEVGAMIARVTGSGILDVTFGFGGVVVSPPYTPMSGGQPASIDEWTWARPIGDEIVVLGDSRSFIPAGQCGSYQPGKNIIMIGRYFSNGALDTNYGGNGTGRAIYPLGQYTSSYGEQGALDSQNRLVVATSGTNGTYCNDLPTVSDYVAARFTPTGLLDTTFNGVGYVGFAFTAGPTDFDLVAGVTVDANDRPILLGSPNNSGFGLGCLTTGGVLDTTFGP